ncbi:small ribosomal subunit protein uS2-like [Mirounga angustirostris]|uniref:small ribosomal subunit protein uS2-like n=1 Tax=Mirounga angustirostris TaxID=9716 RepID=UPI00313B128A
MSADLDVLQMKEEDVIKSLAAGTNLGGTNFDIEMEQYIYKRKSDGVYIKNLKRTWEKLLLAARAIVAIENPADVNVISSGNTDQRAVLKFAAATGATPIVGCFTPGTFANQIQAAFQETSDSLLRYVHIAIPCNNKGTHSDAGPGSSMHVWHHFEVMPDFYFYRDPEEIEKEEQAIAEKAVMKEGFQGEWTTPAPEFTTTQPEVADWSESVQVPFVHIQQFPTENWSAQPTPEDWSAAPTAQTAEWVGTTTVWS